MEKQYNTLPDNWKDLDHQAKGIWFARHCTNYTREGEAAGIREEVPAEVAQAYEAWQKEE